jgi:hypothetical protein
MGHANVLYANCTGCNTQGKTTAVAMIVAVLMYVCSKITITIFSQTQDISNMFLDKTLMFFNMLPRAEERILVLRSGRLCTSRYDDFARGTSPDECFKNLRWNKLQARSSSVGGKYTTSPCLVCPRSVLAPDRECMCVFRFCTPRPARSVSILPDNVIKLGH